MIFYSPRSTRVYTIQDNIEMQRTLANMHVEVHANQALRRWGIHGIPCDLRGNAYRPLGLSSKSQRFDCQAAEISIVLHKDCHL